MEVHEEIWEHRRRGEVIGECGDEFRREFVGSEDVRDGFGGGGGIGDDLLLSLFQRRIVRFSGKNSESALVPTSESAQALTLHSSHPGILPNPWRWHRR